MATDPIDSAHGRPNIHDATGQGRTTPDRIWPATKQAIGAAGFVLLKRLPSGASSDVWTARKTINGRALGIRLVVKVLVEPRDPAKMRLFDREVKILNSENLPRDVVPMLHYHQEPDDRGNPTVQPFIVMEEIVGVPILDYARSLKTTESRLNLIADAFEALGRIHDHDILHGDISHNNLYVEASGRVRAIDFGGSKAVNQVGTQSATIHVGTTQCAPPSYLAGHAKLEAWVDIHSLGSVAFRVLAETWSDKSSQGPARNRSRLRDRGVPEPAVETIVKCLREKDQSLTVDRELYASPQQVADEIRSYLRRREIRSLRRRQSLATVCVMLPFLALASLGWWFWWSGERDARTRQVDLLRKQVEGLSGADHPAVKELAAKADGLLRERDEALTRGEPFTADARARDLVANLTRQIALRQGVERCRPYLKSLGETLNRTPWILDAPTIAAGRANLDRDYLAIGSRLERGETDIAWRELGLFHEALVTLSERNKAASISVESRARWKRNEEALSDRLRRLAAGDKDFAEAARFATDGETSWKEGKWTEAKRDYDLAIAKLDAWLSGKETPEELAARRQSDRQSIEEALRREQKLKDQIAVLEERLKEIGKLQGQITQLNALNLADRATAKAAAKDLENETALRKSAEKKRDEALASSTKAQQDLTFERSAREKTQGELTALQAKSKADAAKHEQELSAVRSTKAMLEMRVADLTAKLKEETGKSSETADRLRSALVDLQRWEDKFRELKTDPLPRVVAGWTGTKAGDRKVVEFRGQTIAFRWCPPDSYKMGGASGVEVNLTQGFWMLETEVTQGLWTAGEGPALDWSKWGKGPNYPVYNVSHVQAVAFIAKLNELLHHHQVIPADVQLALPTEAQWEYAYRAGTTGEFFCDRAKLGEYAWFEENEKGAIHPVATKRPNPWGVHDMAGSLWEWTADWYAVQLSGGDNPTGPASGVSRVYRAGGWCSEAKYCTAVSRDATSPNFSDGNLGFRVLAAVRQAGRVSGNAENGEANRTATTPSGTAVSGWTGTKVGDRRVVDFRGQKIAFRWCPPGSFRMGKAPGVKVNLTQGFWMMETELTQGLWTAVEGKELDWSTWGKGPNHPVYNVSHDRAVAFIAKLNLLLHQENVIPADVQLALPTEAHWEYAYRAGTTGEFFCDRAELGEYAWFIENDKGSVQPVATKKPNPWGLHDMSGSLWEWTADRYADHLAGGDDPRGPASGTSRVYRGGGRDNTAEGCTAAFRSTGSPDFSNSLLGFRLLAVPSTGPKAGDRKVVSLKGVEIPFRWCPPGSFIMGGESPRSKVRLTRGFWMMETEVTQRLWMLVQGRDTGWKTADGKGPDYPVYNVNHDQVLDFVVQLNRLLDAEKAVADGVRAALPTEAQWEYAYRAGTTTAYHFGDDPSALGDYAWFNWNRTGAQVVATKKPNPWGLHDMAGNVWEWTADWYDVILRDGDDPVGPESGLDRVIRGGDSSSTDELCTADCRIATRPDASNSGLGFRVLLTSPGGPDR